MSKLTLIQIEADGTAPTFSGTLCDTAIAVADATAKMYADTGFVPPWIGYLAVRDSLVLGSCGFKGPPKDNEVEIAYYTFPGNEGAGVGTEMASAIIQHAIAKAPDVLITAQTLPERNASHRILEKVGFSPQSTIQHPEDGTVLLWHRGT